MQLEKDKELRELASECQLFRATSESLELELAKLHTLLANIKQRQREMVDRLVSERDAHAASLANKEEQIGEMQRAHEAITVRMSGDHVRLQSEHDKKVLELDQMKHTVLPRAINILVDQSEEAFDEVRKLEARYAHFSRHMDDKAAQIARENEAKLAELAREKETMAAELDRDKDAFIHKLGKRCDQFKEMANALSDRRLPDANPSTLIRSFESPTEPPPPPPPTNTTTSPLLLPPPFDGDE